MATLHFIDEMESEFQRIAAKIRGTIVEHKFVRLAAFLDLKMWRIDNPRLTEVYARSKENLRSQNEDEPEEEEFYHGTPFFVDICNNGFSENKSKTCNMFGPGVYFAAHASKANQYSWGANTGCPPHNDRNCDICPRYLIVCSCAMGRKFRATRQPLDTFPQGFDSIVALPDDVAGLKHPEFILRRGEQALPKVLVQYHAERCAD